MLLVSDTSYTFKDRASSSSKYELLLQTTLSAGTAKYYIKNKGASGFTFVKDLSDVPELISAPKNGDFKVTLTGSAVVHAEFR